MMDGRPVGGDYNPSSYYEGDGVLGAEPVVGVEIAGLQARPTANMNRAWKFSDYEDKRVAYLVVPSSDRVSRRIFYFIFWNIHAWWW